MRAYRERRWLKLEETLRRIIREELNLAAGRTADGRWRTGAGAVENRPDSVDKSVDKRHRDSRARADDGNPAYQSLLESEGDEEAPTWTTEEELFPWARPPSAGRRSIGSGPGPR